jgi:hypothetical protein
MAPINVSLEQEVRIPVGESSVIVSAKTILGDLLARLQPKSRTDTPRLGEHWQGGIYSGIVRGFDGAPDYHLVVLDVISMKDLTWQKAMDWAAECEHEGFKDYTLPNLRDQSMARANIRELFEDDYYWSCEEYAGDPGCAWLTGFYYGYQGGCRKSSSARARAVRRSPIL